jgi:hypothetical protein
MGNSPELLRRHYTVLMPEVLTGTVKFRNDKLNEMYFMPTKLFV